MDHILYLALNEALAENKVGKSNFVLCLCCLNSGLD